MLPDRRSGLSYNGSIRPALAVGAKTSSTPLRLDGRGQDRCRIASIAMRACMIASLRSLSASDGFWPLSTAASRWPAASATPNAPIARADPFSVCAGAPRVSGQGGETADQAGRLSRKHRQHLALEPGVAQRHALEMVHVDRTVVGGERRRWHPGDPFQMKRHGDNPISPPDRSGSDVFGRQSWKWLTERVGSGRKFALFLAKSSLN